MMSAVPGDRELIGEPREDDEVNLELAEFIRRIGEPMIVRGELKPADITLKGLRELDWLPLAFGHGDVPAWAITAGCVLAHKKVFAAAGHLAESFEQNFLRRRSIQRLGEGLHTGLMVVGEDDSPPIVPPV